MTDAIENWIEETEKKRQMFMPITDPAAISLLTYNLPQALTALKMAVEILGIIDRGIETTGIGQTQSLGRFEMRKLAADGLAEIEEMLK